MIYTANPPPPSPHSHWGTNLPFQGSNLVPPCFLSAGLHRTAVPKSDLTGIGRDSKITILLQPQSFIYTRYIAHDNDKEMKSYWHLPSYVIGHVPPETWTCMQTLKISQLAYSITLRRAGKPSRATLTTSNSIPVNPFECHSVRRSMILLFAPRPKLSAPLRSYVVYKA